MTETNRVFRDLEIVEHLGSGVPRILKAYGRDAFEIRDSFIRIVFRFKTVLSEKTVVKTVGETVGKPSEKPSEKILKIVGENHQVTIAELAGKTGVSPRSVERNIKKLQEEGLLKRVGPDKGGHWEVIGEDAT